MLKGLYGLLSLPSAALDYYNKAYPPAGDIEALPYGDPDTLPSMWSYDDKSLPREFYNMEPDTFLENPLENNLVLFPRETLKLICSMLPPKEFIRLSRTCRYLHWVLYTYCTCHVKEDEMCVRYNPKHVCPGEIRIWEDRQDEMAEAYRDKEWYFMAPRFLKRPFLVMDVHLYLKLGVYEEEMYNRIVELIKPFERCYKYIQLVNIADGPWPNEEATCKFIMDVDAVGYRVEKTKSSWNSSDYSEGDSRKLKIEKSPQEGRRRNSPVVH